MKAAFLAFLSAIAPVLLAFEASAAEIQVKQIQTGRDARVLEVSGGSGDRAWHIRYGSLRSQRALSLAGPGPAAYFTHGNWLRRVDVEKGAVTGRWHFPSNSISLLNWRDGRLEVEVDDLDGAPRRVLDFNPDAPEIPYWGAGSLLAARLSFRETLGASVVLSFDRTRQAVELPEARNAAERDPLSPWLKIELARIYQTLKIPGAEQLFNEAIRLESTDFSELLPISATLDEWGQPEAAREAFERGYEDYWKRGTRRFRTRNELRSSSASTNSDRGSKTDITLGSLRKASRNQRKRC